MEKSIKKFLDFNGKKVYFITRDGIWWVAIKPICEALNVNYNRQFQNIKADEILGPAFAIQQMQVPGDQGRGWACLPEFFVYGWIFSIQSDSPELKQYKWKCYEILHNYFHGTITNASKHMKAKSEAEKQLEQIEEELQNSDLFKKRQELVDKIKQENKAAYRSVKEYLDNQLSLWETDQTV